jgi:sugar phosphate isomerase/epimerase
MYSFSTCWNSHRHTDGRSMLREIRDLGFEYAELSHGTRVALVPGIIEAVEAGEIKISTLHNFCPLPMGVNHSAPNLYQFTDERARERELAQRYTIKTIEFAARLKAPLVVLHCGSIEMKDYTDKMIEMVGRGERFSPKFERLAREATDHRQKKSEPFVKRMKEGLGKLLSIAESRGIKLGIENRQSFEELPIDSDFPEILRDLNSPSLVYWHDTGHAQIKENLGLIDHGLQLGAVQDHLAGFHLHDVQFPGRDHCAPGTGCINFSALKPVLKPHHIKVFELSPTLPVEEVKKGVEYLKGILDGRG